MSDTRQQEYVGPIEHLKGKRALVRSATSRRGYVLVQFNGANLTRNGKPSDDLTDDLSFGWHYFHYRDFKPS